MAFLISNGKFVVANGGSFVLCTPQEDVPDHALVSGDNLYLQDKEKEYLTFTPDASKQ